MKSTAQFVAIGMIATMSPAAAQDYAGQEPVLYRPSYVETPVELLSRHWGGGYAGVSFGRIDGTVTEPGGVETDGQGNALGLFAGGLQDRGFIVTGVELSYDLLNNIDVDNGQTGDGSLLTGKFMLGYDAGQILPYAAIGVSRISLDDVNTDGSGGDATGVMLGIGAKFMPQPKLLLGGEISWHNFSNFGDNDNSDLETTRISISAAYRF